MGYVITTIDQEVLSHPEFPTPSVDAILYADINQIPVEHQEIIEEILALFHECETNAGWASDTDFEAYLLYYVRNCMEYQTNPTWELLSIKKLWATIWYGEQCNRERQHPSDTPLIIFALVLLTTAIIVTVTA